MYKQKDLILFSLLRKNSRMSLVELGRQTQTPVSTVYQKLRESFRTVIKKHTVVLDFAKLGYGVRVHFFLKAPGNTKEKLLEFLLRKQNVNNAYRINNGFDVLGEAIFRDINTAEKFIDELQEKYHVAKLHTFYILDDIVREKFFETPPPG